jgi:hypothetical protein
MRKFMVIPLAALLVLAVAAPASAGANTYNSSGSALTAQGSWFSDAGGAWTSGSLYAWQETGSSSTYLEFFEETGQYVDCTPADDTDEFYGFQGQYRYGYGEGTLTMGQGLSQAHASGVLDIGSVTVDDCVGLYDESWAGGVPVSLDLVATGPKTMERGTSSFKVPSEYNGHSSYSTTFRAAAGSATIGDEPDFAVDGGIGKVSWRDHGNG